MQTFPEAEAGYHNLSIQNSRGVGGNAWHTHSLAAAQINYDFQVCSRSSETGVREEFEAVLVRFHCVPGEKVADLFEEEWS